MSGLLSKCCFATLVAHAHARVSAAVLVSRPRYRRHLLENGQLCYAVYWYGFDAALHKNFYKVKLTV